MTRSLATRSSSRRRQRRARAREGAVMLVVMLILLTATTMGALALQSTQHELRSAGYNRLAMQTHYVSEAALVTTLSWIDATSASGTFYTGHLLLWRNGTQANPNPVPNMEMFGEPDINPNNRAWANRTTWGQQRLLLPDGIGWPPITQPGFNSAIASLSADVFGSLGPRSAYAVGAEVPGSSAQPTDGVDYVVDLYDCQQLPVTASPGSQINQGGSNTLQQVQFYCVITARGRTFVAGANAPKAWSLDTNGARTYNTSRFTAANDARGTIITPPIIIP